LGFVANPHYSAIKANAFMLIHCISGFYNGYQFSCMNNLAKPILRSSFGVTDESDQSHYQGIFGLSFGAGKVLGSLFGGSFAKLIGKQNVLYVAEIFNVISSAMMIVPDMTTFCLARGILGFCCGLNSTNAPRLIMENYSVTERGRPTTIYS
jgi:MFS family permease